MSQTEAVVQPFKFAGVYYDSQTGLYKMGARYYDPTIGRFTQVDPIAMPNVMKNGGWPWFIHLCRSGQDAIGALSNSAFCPGGCNFFVYAGNDPVNMVDLTGYFHLGQFLFKAFETVDIICATGLVVCPCTLAIMGAAAVDPIAGIAVGVMLVPIALGATYCGYMLLNAEWKDFEW